ncbi:MAG: long-chain fatty acid--CoA ligase [Candidatus Thermoplasmatota archaeon]|nr:long-chain fatty acid--CoA ligase [Candidatus Thermoplasmatota archaeon]
MAGTRVTRERSKRLERAGFKNIYDMFEKNVEACPDKKLVQFKIQTGDWGFMTFRDMRQGSLDCASALLSMGIGKGDRVAFVTNNRYEWMMVDLAVQRIGAINVSNYVTPDPEKLLINEIEFNLDNSGSRLVLVAGNYAPKFLDAKDNGHFKTVEKVILLDIEKEFRKREDTMTFMEFLDLGRANRRLLENFKEKVTLDDVATLIYTSGSTGVPKGVVLTHGSLLSNVENIAEVIDISEKDIEMSFLPIGHVFERIINYLLIRIRGTVGYAQSIETIADDSLVLRPTVFPAVPRVFEKFKVKVEDNARSKGALSYGIYKWSLGVGSKYSHGKTGPITSIKYRIAKKLVFDKVVAKLGGRVRFFVSSSAPLSEDTSNFFRSMNFEILEAYGMTEAGPLISINRNGKGRIGTVGEFIPELSYRIAEDGEILIKGPGMMKGFWNRPDAEQEAFVDGWFATGDIGVVSEDGYLTITDRKKNLIKTSNGKYVPPAPIEDRLVSSEYISQAMVIGDKRPHCSAIIVPDFQRLEDYAQQNNIHYTSYQDLVDQPSINKFFEEVVKKETANFAHHEQPKKVLIGSKEWTWETGELTPTQKVRRTVILKQFNEQIETLYSLSRS